MKNKIYPYLVLIACALLIATTFGFVNIQGLFFDSIANDLEVGVGTVSMYVTIVHIIGAIFGPIGVNLRQKYSIRTILIITGIFVVGAYALLPLTNNIYLTYMCAFFMGVGQGIYGHTMVVELMNKWFEKSGTFIGIALSFSGLFGSVFSPIIVNRIIKMGWRKAYYIFAIILAIVLIYSILVINDKPTNNKTSKTKQKIKLSKQLKLIALFYLVGGSISSMGHYLLGYSTSIGLTLEQGAILTSAMNIGNLTLKLVFGYLSDKIGGLKTAIVNFICISIGCITLLICPSNLLTILTIGTILLGSSYGAANVVTQGLCKDLFGRENVSANYANLSVLSSISAFSTTAIGYVYDLTNSYRTSIIGLQALFVVAILLVLIAFKKDKTK